MQKEITYTSAKENFAKWHLSIEDFIDEKTWNNLSEWAQLAVFELSNTLIEYIHSAITQAVENDPDFIHEFKELSLKILKQENHENEERDKKLENTNITFP